MGLADLLLGSEHRSITLPSTVLTDSGSGVATVGGATHKDWWGTGDERGLSTSAIVRRCLSIITQPLSSLDLTVLGPDEEVVEHPFTTIFNKGGAGSPMSARIVKEVAFARLEWRGQSFLYLDRGDSGKGPVQNMAPLYRQTQAVVDRQTGGMEVLVGYRTKDEKGQWVGLLPSEVLWLRYPDPDDPWGCVAPWTAARFAAKLDRKAGTWMDEELTNGNRSASVVYLGDMEREDHDKAHALWQRTMSGPRSSGRAFLTSGPVPAQVHRLGLTAKEAAYLDTRKFNWQEVALGFGIDRDYIFGESTYENKRAAKTGLWSDLLIPKLEVMASEIDRQVLPEPGLEAAWDLSEVEALHENETAIVDRLKVLLEADAITIDEARAERGMEPLPGGLGANTLTAYRKAVSGGSAAAPVAPDADAVVEVEDEDEARVRRFVTRRGQRVIRRRPARRARVQVRAMGDRDEETVQRLYTRFEEKGTRLIEAYAERQARVVIRNFTKASQRATRTAGGVETRAGVDEFYDAAYWRGQLSESLDGWLDDVWDEGGRRTAASLGIGFDTYDEGVTAAMERRLEVLADQVTATTREALESGALQRAAEEGLSVADTARLMREEFDQLGTSRAQMIARTETVGGFNAASRTVAKGSGLVTRRQWLAAKDDRVRDSHRGLDGYTTEGMDDRYPNGLMHPGDPTGPPRETINCRCVEIFVMDEEEA